MRKLLATAAFLLASTAAQAQYTFEYGGRTIRIDPDRGTVQIPGVYDNTGQGKAKKAKKNETSPGQQAPQQAKVDPQPQAAPAPVPAPVVAPPATEQAPAAAAPPPVPPPPAPPPSATASNAPAETAVLPPPAPPPAPAPVEQQAAPAAAPPPAPTVAAAPPAPRPAPAPAGAPARDLNSPLGIWLTEEKEGKVRIEQCGSNLCGYSVDSKSNQNGEQVLINMKPAKDQNKDQKWSGRILDPNTGSTYDSTIAMKGTDRLRVQGCAFGGMFCGGQTWTRVN
ncbi:DUF2147 domain-containing protein [Bradyrhizobium japonicum]|uniref:DUF2147 domain-containing protein n=1 Tax=Bradyrhizobium japonicum TaxID=375 RepID=UPI0020A0DBA3|nr:DUF2147 domain-containing protein [Bradyrhizobium japonicum]MCP1765930.1 uncharacterized protein (DUF2147 family) [Bradyrhizobium japonicum]MCP1788067.1 uncharacterized protein (DUF2147 family) [Bradyrhizobium japonicum]MCP1809943.1 uncharacterized protein (DUF2147 family) [Bradyrhizobium japonicum]MCP1818877.1 uncharacterized protein (DUF2147 family) [Bradyrhizobium japonicum]MCP1869613.1 uncharacterized protein (DUF2147 family) [Bradyrhizobium japonicum]